MLPYLTYVTFGTYMSDKRGVKRIFDDSEARKIAVQAGKIPLVRFFDSYPERYKSKDMRQKYGDEMIEIALGGGYKGVVINGAACSGLSDAFSEFIIEMRKKLMGNDLILLCEVDAESPASFSEYADGSILSYHKYAGEPSKDFNAGESAVLSGFACTGESAKAFIDLPALACCGEAFIGVQDVIDEARSCGGKIKNDELCKTSSFVGKCGEWHFTSLNAIKSIFELISEYDYSGVCFDIMRAPISHIMMYNACFKTAYGTNVRTREGCSREV